MYKTYTTAGTPTITEPFIHKTPGAVITAGDQRSALPDRKEKYILKKKLKKVLLMCVSCFHFLFFTAII